LLAGRQRDGVRAALDEVLDAQNAGDAGRLGSRLSVRPDAVHIGTDAGEWWTSKEILDAMAAAGGDDIQVVPTASTFTSWVKASRPIADLVRCR
jgi:hypothetical protein